MNRLDTTSLYVTGKTLVEQEALEYRNEDVVFTTDNGDIIFGLRKDGRLFTKNNEKTVYELNINKDALLHSACNFYCGVRKTQFIISTDTHENIKAFDRFVGAVNDFETPNFGLFCGDIITYGCTSRVGYMEHFKDVISKSNKPIFVICGNHDVGHANRAVHACASNKQLYEWFVKPAVDRNWLMGEYNDNNNIKGEYVVNKPYFSKDFHNGTLLIGLYAYDDNNAFDTEYWEPVAYSDSYDDIAGGLYSVGDIVNVKGYTDFSFRCVQEVNVPNISSYSVNDVTKSEYYPKYKAVRSWRWYSEEQLRWLCNKLKYASENNLTVIIAHHMPFTTKGNFNPDSPFAGNDTASTPGNYGYRYSEENTDIIADIVNAAVTKGNIENIDFTPIAASVSGAAPDDVSSIPSFVFSYDFSEISGEIKGVFHIGGHYHTGGLIEHNTYNQKQLIQDCGRTDASRSDNNNRIGKSVDYSNVCFDRLNVLTVFDDSIHVTRLGSDYINKEENGEFISRNNRIITF